MLSPPCHFRGRAQIALDFTFEIAPSGLHRQVGDVPPAGSLDGSVGSRPGAVAAAHDEVQRTALNKDAEDDNQVSGAEDPVAAKGLGN